MSRVFASSQKHPTTKGKEGMEIARNYPSNLVAMPSTMTFLENENTGAYGKLVNFLKLSSRRTSFGTERFVLCYKTDA